jgi:hypothetical protein
MRFEDRLPTRMDVLCLQFMAEKEKDNQKGEINKRPNVLSAIDNGDIAYPIQHLRFAGREDVHSLTHPNPTLRPPWLANLCNTSH